MIDWNRIVGIRISEREREREGRARRKAIRDSLPAPRRVERERELVLACSLQAERPRASESKDAIETVCVVEKSPRPRHAERAIVSKHTRADFGTGGGWRRASTSTPCSLPAAARLRSTVRANASCSCAAAAACHDTGVLPCRRRAPNTHVKTRNRFDSTAAG